MLVDAPGTPPLLLLAPSSPAPSDLSEPSSSSVARVGRPPAPSCLAARHRSLSPPDQPDRRELPRPSETTTNALPGAVILQSSVSGVWTKRLRAASNSPITAFQESEPKSGDGDVSMDSQATIIDEVHCDPVENEDDNRTESEADNDDESLGVEMSVVDPASEVVDYECEDMNYGDSGMRVDCGESPNAVDADLDSLTFPFELGQPLTELGDAEHEAMHGEEEEGVGWDSFGDVAAETQPLEEEPITCARKRKFESLGKDGTTDDSSGQEDAPFVFKSPKKVELYVNEVCQNDRGGDAAAFGDSHADGAHLVMPSIPSDCNEEYQPADEEEVAKGEEVGCLSDGDDHQEPLALWASPAGGEPTQPIAKRLRTAAHNEGGNGTRVVSVTAENGPAAGADAVANVGEAGAGLVLLAMQEAMSANFARMQEQLSQQLLRQADEAYARLEERLEQGRQQLQQQLEATAAAAAAAAAAERERESSKKVVEGRASVVATAAGGGPLAVVPGAGAGATVLLVALTAAASAVATLAAVSHL
ncbi:hypothetical protein DFJ73DRAFT_827817 [Zopfochytrium polystomum]|nr:hypothetical protein DFJ73DRAFT_827817 [Zopfochytrium polystomum]